MNKLFIPIVALAGILVVACSNGGSESNPPAGTSTTTTTGTTGTSQPATTAATASTTGSPNATAGETAGATGGSPTTAATGAGGFAGVASTFNANCMPCHSDQRHRGGLSLASYAGLMKGGDDGVVVKPGDPDHSIIVQVLHGPVSNPKIPKMPMNGKTLPDADIKAITDWVKNGAKQ